MTKRIILLSLGCCLLIVSAGCHGYWRGGCGPYGCDDGPACSSCGGGGCGSCTTRATCGSGGCGSCSECSPGYTCYGPLCGFRPLRWVVNLFRCPCWCGPSCGEAYWGEFHNDPPDCWDPCDQSGNWTGRGGCSSCNHGGGGGNGGGIRYEDAMPSTPEASPEMIPEGTIDGPAAQPTPAVKPHKTARASGSSIVR